MAKFNVTRDSATGQLVVERQLEGENVSIMAGSGNHGIDRSELQAYALMIGNLVEANRARMLAFERTYYSEVPLLAQPADYQAKEFGGPMTPLWALLNPATPSRWFEPDSSQPVVFYVNPAGAPGFLRPRAPLQAVITAW